MVYIFSFRITKLEYYTYTTSNSGYCLGGGNDEIDISGIASPGVYTVSAKAGDDDDGESIDVMAVQTDLDTDIDGDGDIDNDDDDPLEYDPGPGGYIAVDGDRKLMVFNVEPYWDLYEGYVKIAITQGNTKADLYTSETSGTPLYSDSITFNLWSQFWDFDYYRQHGLYIKAVEASSTPKDIEVSLFFYSPDDPSLQHPVHQDKVKFTAAELKVCVDADMTTLLTDWPEESELPRSPKYIFGHENGIYLEVKLFPGPNPDGFDLVSNLVKVTSGSGHEIYLSFWETGVNTNTFRTFFYLSDIDYVDASSSQKRVDDEEVISFWLKDSLISSTYTNVYSVMVDTAEIAAVDGTDTLDADTFFSKMLQKGWYYIDLFDKNHNPAEGTDDKCADLATQADFLYIAGHCSSQDSPTRIYAYDNSYGLKDHDHTSENLEKADLTGLTREIDWLVLACCSTCNLNDGRPQRGAEWVNLMNSGLGLHGIMGYRYGAPGGSTPTTDVTLASEFATALNSGSSTIKDAWINTGYAHKNASDDHHYSPLNAVAIFKNGMEGDKVGPASGTVSSQSIARDTTVSTYKYYWIDWTGNNDPGDYYVEQNSVSKEYFSYTP